MNIYRVLINPYKYLSEGKLIPKWGIIKLHFGKPYAFRLFFGQDFIEIGTNKPGIYLQKKD